MTKKAPQFNLRIPEDLKRWLEAQALRNCRSQTAEVVYLLAAAKRNQEQANA